MKYVYYTYIRIKSILFANTKRGRCNMKVMSGRELVIVSCDIYAH